MRVDKIVAGPDGEAKATVPLDKKSGRDDDIPF